MCRIIRIGHLLGDSSSFKLSGVIYRESMRVAVQRGGRTESSLHPARSIREVSTAESWSASIHFEMRTKLAFFVYVQSLVRVAEVIHEIARSGPVHNGHAFQGLDQNKSRSHVCRR